MFSSAVSQKRVEYEPLAGFQPHRAVEFSFDAATRTDRLYREIMKVGCSVLSAAVVAAALHIFVRVPHPLGLGLGLSGIFSIVSFSSIPEMRNRTRLWLRAERSDAERVLIVGAGAVGRALASHFQETKATGVRVVGFLDEDISGDPAILGKPEDLHRAARQHFIDEVFLATTPNPAVTGILWSDARAARVNMSLIGSPQITEISSGAGVLAIRYPVVAIIRRPKHLLPTILKRQLDVLLAASLLVLFSPLMLVVAIAVKMDSDGQILYRCPRLGKRGVQFSCYKFRTMVSDAHAMRDRLKHLNEYEQILFKIREDPRITPLGRFLRKYSLDELPQLWNVLIGDMSLVGPRPPLPEEYEQYSIECLQRLQVKPGITGLWQVTARQSSSFNDYVSLDLQYVENWSLWWDLKILAQTIPAVFSGTGC